MVELALSAENLHLRMINSFSIAFRGVSLTVGQNVIAQVLCHSENNNAGPYKPSRSLLHECIFHKEIEELTRL